MEQRIIKLKTQIKELQDWKRINGVRQIPKDISANVINLIQHNHLVVTGKVVTTVSSFDTWLEVILDDKTFLIPATPSI